MHTLYALYRFLNTERTRQAFARLALEATTLAKALASPNKLVAEVEAMRALHVEADRIEATQPMRAAVLRGQAAMIGVR